MIAFGYFLHIHSRDKRSDAIAGVIAFILNDEPGADSYVQLGEYDGGDGRNLQV